MLSVDVDLDEDGFAGVFLGEGFVGRGDLAAGAAALWEGGGRRGGDDGGRGARGGGHRGGEGAERLHIFLGGICQAPAKEL